MKSQSELKRVGKELYVLRVAQENREARLREADSQLGQIQNEWLGVHKKLQDELQNHRVEAHRLKQVCQILEFFSGVRFDYLYLHLYFYG